MKSFLNEKSYGFALLRHQKLKTRFASKAKKVRRKPRPNFSTSGNSCRNFPTIQKFKKNVKMKSFLKKKRYGFPLLRRAFSKTRCASKAKKVCGKTRPNFSTSGNISHHCKISKNVKSKSFLKKKSYGNPLLRMQKSKTRFASKTKKVCEKQAPFFHIWKFFAWKLPRQQLPSIHSLT
jgi:hypothetical protein